MSYSPRKLTKNARLGFTFVSVDGAISNCVEANSTVGFRCGDHMSIKSQLAPPNSYQLNPSGVSIQSDLPQVILLASNDLTL